jgi:hypothetical protein
MNYKWVITALTTQTVGDLQYVVTNVKFNLFGDNSGLSTRYVGNISLPTPDPATFIPFDQLTREVALGWVESIVTGDTAGWQTINDTLNTQITEAEAALTQFKALPWNKQAS